MKTLTYAYAWSDNAHQYNYGRGCWLVNDRPEHYPFVFQDSERLQALAYFESLNCAIDKAISFTRYHSPFVDIHLALRDNGFDMALLDDCIITEDGKVYIGETLLIE